jgi:hypothetical protein
MLMTLAAAWSAVLGGRALADPPFLGDIRYLPGDQTIGSSVETQDLSRVSAGAGRYLVVWEEERPVLSGFTNTNEPLGGNEKDIYAARIDAAGNLMGAGPIVVSQEGRNQSRPQVAWNEGAQQWLIVWMTERPEWYFYHDIVGARVSAEGVLLDPVPIPLRPENDTPSNDYAMNPSVGSDGTTWLVVWQDTYWNGGLGYPNLAGKRVAADGSILDPSPVVLFQHGGTSFGPIMPHLAWAGDEYMLVWEHSGYYDVLARRIAGDLQPIGAEFLVSSVAYGPRVATNGADFLVVTRFNNAHRVTHGGVSLDPDGIPLEVQGGNDPRGPDVAWNGTHWCVAVSSSRTYPNPPAIFLTRITTGGAVVPPGGVALHPNADDQYVPAIASLGDGSSQIVWSERNIGQQILEDIHGTRIDVDGVPGPNVPVSVGLPRQSYVRFATNGDQHMAVYLSQGDGNTRIMAQRIDLLGEPIDAGAVEIGRAPETFRIYPDVAWNGSVYLVAWTLNGAVLARRIGADGVPVDANPVSLISDTAGSVGVGALGDNFLLAYPHTFSGDQVSLKGVVVRGADLALVGSSFTIGGSFVSLFPRVHALGTRWLAVWEHRPTHDSPASSVFGAFVDANGTPGAPFTISDAGYGFEPSLAVGNDRAFIVWADDVNYNNATIEGRMLDADGSFPGAAFLLCDAPRNQFFPACGWDGQGFLAAWNDYRMLGEVEQPRGDIYAARVGWDGTVQDPGGFEATNGPLPEDLAAIAGAGGRSILAFSKLHGPTDAYIQRIGYRLTGLAVADAQELSSGRAAWRIGPNPFRSHLTVEYAGAPSAGSIPAKLEIYELSGRRLATAPLDPIRGGSWDGRDAHGRAVPAGTYLTRVVRGERVLARRSVTRLD